MEGRTRGWRGGWIEGRVAGTGRVTTGAASVSQGNTISRGSRADRVFVAFIGGFLFAFRFITMQEGECQGAARALVPGGEVVLVEDNHVINQC